MGEPLGRLLAQKKHHVYVTTRKQRISEDENIHYILGDAHDFSFVTKLKEKGHYNVIVDFMNYRLEEFEGRAHDLLEMTEHYFFMSSGRVYADSKEPITEDSPRLLDICKDESYLKTDEYALAKAREENILFETDRKNWTIIRPYITYNTERLQLGTLEKDVWLYRGLQGKQILLPKDIGQYYTTMTYGGDVAKALVCLIENQKGKGEAIHLTGSDSMTWEEVADIYCDVIEKRTGKKPVVCAMESSSFLWKVMNNEYQTKYDRMYNRIFDNSKMTELCGEQLPEFTTMREGLVKCCIEFLDKPKWNPTNCSITAKLDRIMGEKTPLKDFLLMVMGKNHA